MPGFKVITKAVRDEAPKWDGLALDMEAVVREIRDATLGMSAFFVGDPALLPIRTLDATAHAKAYEVYRSFMEGVLDSAATEFTQIADAVQKIAATYEEAENTGEYNMRAVYGEMEK
ncbi:hypothetical protein [Actinophytocola algeriensis]|uniref:PE family protein n=1 Tax=Actinophytocola algeriensis TaxID=1768010 RepID=A0A7W7Q1V5_9PSEU|nr:hypothetical protein [Actinophytocola algeriensis]MBB4905333.1 hypothetical protein [Actinophytocola algeriensis]MBE1472982.1 hypothetical protein [Actinophytocola algeriensis]